MIFIQSSIICLVNCRSYTYIVFYVETYTIYYMNTSYTSVHNSIWSIKFVYNLNIIFYKSIALKKKKTIKTSFFFFFLVYDIRFHFSTIFMT